MYYLYAPFVIITEFIVKIHTQKIDFIYMYSSLLCSTFDSVKGKR